MSVKIHYVVLAILFILPRDTVDGKVFQGACPVIKPGNMSIDSTETIFNNMLGMYVPVAIMLPTIIRDGHILLQPISPIDCWQFSISTVNPKEPKLTHKYLMKYFSGMRPMKDKKCDNYIDGLQLEFLSENISPRITILGDENSVGMDNNCITSDFRWGPLMVVKYVIDKYIVLHQCANKFQRKTSLSTLFISITHLRKYLCYSHANTESIPRTSTSHMLKSTRKANKQDAEHRNQPSVSGFQEVEPGIHP
ncbi:hypothetical protein DMENIID0001_114190 [Sergentomyia squamirostris]